MPRSSVICRITISNEHKIIDELNAARGSAVDIGGYYHPDPELTAAAMRPSATFNAPLNSIH